MATRSDAPGLAANGFGDRDVAPILPDEVDHGSGDRGENPWKHVHTPATPSLYGRFLHSASSRWR